MHVFITGGAGFIGSHTAEHLIKRGDSVSILDAFDFGYDPRLKEANAVQLSAYPECKLYRGDIRDRDLLNQIFSERKPDVVVHLAARAGVRPSLLDPLSYSDINIQGTINILETMRAHQVNRLVFASSSSVYGSRNKGPFRESDSVNVPVSPYAATKRAGELICATYHHLYQMNATCLRFFTVYGPRQRPEMAIHLFAEKIKNGETITMFGDGSSLRDYTFVDDIVRGVLAAIDRPLGYQIVNLGNCSPIRLDRLIQKISEAVGTPAIVEQMPDQPGDVPMTFADVTRAQTLLGYAPDTPLDTGLRTFVSWLEQRQ